MTLPQTTEEQRRPLYEDLETLMVEGFLSHEVYIQGTHFCLRTLCPGDIFLLRHRVGSLGLGWQAWSVASSIWMVDGSSFLEEPAAAPRIAKHIQKMPEVILGVLVSIVLGLFLRQNRAAKGAEAFCYEEHARQLWRSHGRNVPTVMSGVQGVQGLGLNFVQRIWSVFNQMEDTRRDHKLLWEAAKLITSASSPKGVQKIDQKDKQLQQQEDNRRQTVLDSFYYAAKGMVDEDGQILGAAPGTFVGGSHTVEELEEDMRKWVTGEHDWHDKIVADYKRQLTERWEADQRARDERIVVARAAAERREIEESSQVRPRPLVGYTPEQLQQILAQRQPGVPGVTVIGHAPTAEHLYNRYLEHPAKPPPSLSIEEGRVVDKLAPNELQRRITGRPVQFRSGSEG